MARGLTALALVALACALGGCASTEELYAEYDEQMCRVEIEPPPPLASALPERAAEPAPDGPMSLRERIAGSYFPWEPAVYFAFNSDALDAENAALLDGAIEVLGRYTGLKVGLQGFTDRIGSGDYNAWLAARRVGAVRDHLIAHGIALAQIVAQPIGEGLPAFGDDDAAARATNRRVELMLLDEAGRPLHPLFDFGPLGDGDG